jgi:adenine-specific DNA-methyltransferase
LVESIIYLLGLHVDKLYKDGNGIVITGNQNLTDKRITVAFRDVETQDTDWVRAVLENHPCDDFYTNQLGDILLDFGDTKPNSIEAVFKGN